MHQALTSRSTPARDRPRRRYEDPDGLDATLGGIQDAFVTKLDSTGSSDFLVERTLDSVLGAPNDGFVVKLVDPLKFFLSALFEEPALRLGDASNGR